MSVVSQHRAGEDVKKPAPQDTQTRSRLLIGQNGPSDSALAASSGWRLLAAQPLTGTLRAALLGACARACGPRRYTPSMAQVVKPYVQRRVVSVERRILAGTAVQGEKIRRRAQGDGVINPAYIARLNATCRERLAVLTRRGRALARCTATLHYGRYLIGTVYNRGRIASRDARPSTGPEKRSAQRAGQRLRGEQSPAAGGRQRGV